MLYPLLIIYTPLKSHLFRWLFYILVYSNLFILLFLSNAKESIEQIFFVFRQTPVQEKSTRERQAFIIL